MNDTNSSNQLIYSLTGIEKAFGAKQVLRGVDVAVRRGENLVILGGSGTGKSVLLKMLVGLMRADKGEILFEGQSIIGLKEKDFYPIRKRVSYLFQSGALFDSMNVYKNLAYPLLAHTKMTHEEIMPLVEKSLAMVELENVQHLYPVELSGGMMKRVALARAIINQPDVVLYDEPTTGLDPVTTHNINLLIRKLQRELDITSVVVTHDRSTAAHVADRLAFLYDGKMAFVGTPDQAREADLPLLRAYIKGECDE